MEHYWRFFIIIACFITSVTDGHAQSVNPRISPAATFIFPDGKEEKIDSLSSKKDVSGSAPITATFYANPINAEGWNANYEWRFTRYGEDRPWLVRYEEETTVTFTTFGTTEIVCYVTFTNDTDSVVFKEEYWSSEMAPFSCTVQSSKLEMPNAFSPNGDLINDIYKPKKGWQSITEFHGMIFNRWGQKLYEWTDPEKGWDGTYHGSPVKEGVYYCLVKAKGADGIIYNIKRDVNLLRGYNNSSNSSVQ